MVCFRCMIVNMLQKGDNEKKNNSSSRKGGISDGRSIDHGLIIVLVQYPVLLPFIAEILFHKITFLKHIKVYLYVFLTVHHELTIH